MSANTRNYGPLKETHQRVQALLEGRDRPDRDPTAGRDPLEQSPTNRPSRDIGSLNATHQKVQEILASRSPHEQQSGRAHEADVRGPTRPTEPPLQRPRAPGIGGMESQQAYAADMIKFNAASRHQNGGSGGREREDAFYKRHPDLTREGDGPKIQQMEHEGAPQRHGPSR